MRLALDILAHPLAIEIAKEIFQENLNKSLRETEIRQIARDKYNAKVAARDRLTALDANVLPRLRSELATTERSHEADPLPSNPGLIALQKRDLERAERERADLQATLLSK